MTGQQSPASFDWPEAGGSLQPRERDQLGELIKQTRVRQVSIGSPHATYRWDLSRLDRVVAFHAPDMILTTETGVSLSAVKDLAEAEKLWLPLDIPGGDDLSLAEYLAGDHSLSWLSHRYGTARDWVVGLTVLDDRGREVTSGARVVKNVAGYRLAPLYIGARDALGPAVEVSFRLLPLPVPVTMVRWRADDPDPLVTLWQYSCRSSHPSGRGEPWEALRLERRDGRWRLDGMTRFPPETAAAWGDTAGGSREAITETNTPFRESRESTLQNTIRIRVLPTQIPELLASLHALGPDLTCYPAAGVVHLGRLDGSKNQPALESLLAAVAEKRGRVQPLTGDVPVKLPAVADPPADSALMARVKKILDLDGVFGPLPVELW